MRIEISNMCICGPFTASIWAKHLIIETAMADLWEFAFFHVLYFCDPKEARVIDVISSLYLMILLVVLLPITSGITCFYHVLKKYHDVFLFVCILPILSSYCSFRIETAVMLTTTSLFVLELPMVSIFTVHLFLPSARLIRIWVNC